MRFKMERNVKNRRRQSARKWFWHVNGEVVVTFGPLDVNLFSGVCGTHSEEN